MRLLVIGGHFSPALSVIESLPTDVTVLYVGRKHSLEGEKALSLEYQTISAHHIPFEQISTGRLQRSWTRHSLTSLAKLPVGFLQAYKIIRKFKPTVIMGFGGYVQVPLCLIGFCMGIPLVIHEQTLEAGLANKLIAPFAKKICISWRSSSTYFARTKTVLTGNPAVSSVFTYCAHLPKDAGKRPKIVIVGGSQGSHAINMLVAQTIPELVKKYSVLHQTGDAKEYQDFALLNEKKKNLAPLVQNRYEIVKFIDPKDIVTHFASASLVVSRAGINTVTALLVLHKPALLIPLPTSQHDEQRKNAIFFNEHGLGHILLQQNATPEQFLSHIHAMINQKGNDIKKQQGADILIHIDAAKKIREILFYAQKSST